MPEAAQIIAKSRGFVKSAGEGYNLRRTQPRTWRLTCSTALPRTSLGFFPTPIHPLPNLSARLGGPALWVKRDDQTGLATGGNKTRKLEFLVADALQQRADTLITVGAPQSNHARQTAAAAAKAGLKSALVLRGDAASRSNRQHPAGRSRRRGNFLGRHTRRSTKWLPKSPKN